MLAAIGAHLCGDIAQFLVYEPETSHSAIQVSARADGYLKVTSSNPSTEFMAPMVIIELLGNSLMPKYNSCIFIKLLMRL